MKKFLFVVFLILAVAGGVVYYVMPSNYDWDGYVKEVTEQVRKQTGLTLRIQGKPQFFMTPSPSLKVGAVTLSNVREGTFPQILEAQSAEFQFDKGLALKRQVHVKKSFLRIPSCFWNACRTANGTGKPLSSTVSKTARNWDFQACW